ncbi:MAG: hypothetical protein V4850_08835 [Myxococcota bacterium]
MLLLALLACGSDECELVTSDVADDAPLGEFTFTAADVAGVLVGTRALVANDDAGAPFDVELTVARGDGPAVFHDRTKHGRGDPFASTTFELQPACDDVVEVPITLAVWSEAAGVDLVVDVRARTPERGSTELEQVDVWETLPKESVADGLPTPPAGANKLNVSVGADPEGLRRLHLFWSADGGATTVLNFVSGG